MENGLFPARIVDPVTDSNCYLLVREGRLAVIDPNNFELLEEALQKRNMTPDVVLLTHEHCDHIGGLNALRERYRTVVIGSSACARGMQSAKENMSRLMETFLYYKSGEKTFVHYRPFTCDPPDLQFGDSMAVPFADGLLEFVSLPGHTHGSSVIRFGDLLFVGDYLLPGDRVLTRLPGGSEEEYERYAKPWLRTIPDGMWILPGHGEPYRMDEEVRIRHDL